MTYYNTQGGEGSEHDGKAWNVSIELGDILSTRSGLAGLATTTSTEEVPVGVS